jgi:hypothetical protein
LKTITNQEKDREKKNNKKNKCYIYIYIKKKTILKWMKLKNKSNPKEIKIIKRRRVTIRRKKLME